MPLTLSTPNTMRNLLPILSLLFLVGCYDELPSESACHWTEPACADGDFDNDGVKNKYDDFPGDPRRWCGPDNPSCENDDYDGDGVPNKKDDFPDDGDCAPHYYPQIRTAPLITAPPSTPLARGCPRCIGFSWAGHPVQPSDGKKP